MGATSSTLLDSETLQLLKSLIHSVVVCLDGVNARLNKEMEVISVSSSSADRALDIINEMLEELEQE